METKLSQFIIDSRYFVDHFNKHEYLKYCDDLNSFCSSIFEEICDPRTDLELFSNSVIDELVANYETINGRMRKTNAKDCDHIFCAVFLVPCLMSSNNPRLIDFGKIFCDILNQRQITRATIAPTTVEKMQSGFVTNILGFPLESIKGFFNKNSKE